MGKINILGQKFGLLTVIAPAPNDKDGNAMWQCRCECGKEIITRGTRLRQGKAQSCGCVRTQKLIQLNKERITKDITGQKFGLLTALEPIERRTNSSQLIWKCQCDCGNICEVRGVDLRSGNTKSCGCQRYNSYGENKIKTLLDINNIIYNQEKTFNDCIFPDTKYLARFDFYLPDYNTLIEYDGRQHFEIGNGNFDNPTKFELTKQHDEFKNKWAKENGYNLIRIPYTHYTELTLNDLLPSTSTFLT